jgi:hypothetical protein
MIDRQTAKLISRIAENLPPEIDEDVMQDWIENPKALQVFLLGLCRTTPREVLLHTTIQVDRSVPPRYPKFVEAVLHPDLENTGPVMYDFESVTLWLHDEQSGNGIEASQVYEHLKEKDMLKGCLNLQDGHAICKAGAAAFREVFEFDLPFLWKSVAKTTYGFNVPYLTVFRRKVVIRWYLLSLHIDDRHPAALFFNTYIEGRLQQSSD